MRVIGAATFAPESTLATPVPYQTDYLFASPELVDHLLHAEVLDDPDLRTLSDHLPIAAEFDI